MAIEFSRDITFGQYLNLASPIHRLDPRTKIVAVVLFMFALLTARTFSGLALALVVAILLQILSRISLSYTLRGMRLLLNTVVIIFIFQVLFFANPTAPLWQWGIISLSWDGVRQGLLLLFRVVLLYHLTTMLMFTTPLMDLADGMEIMLSPLKRVGIPVNELALTFVIAIKFVPLLVAELERMIKAQAARGASFDSGGVIERTRKLGTIMVPLFVNAFGRAEVLTTAMNARCYRGGRGRTKHRVLTFRPVDYWVLLLIVIFAAAICLLGRSALV